MSTPIAASGPAVEKAASPKAAAGTTHGESGDNPFGALLGVALAGSAASQAAADAKAAAPATTLEPMLLELVLDGEWTLDLPTESTEPTPLAPPATSGNSDGALTAVVLDGGRGTGDGGIAPRFAGSSSGVPSSLQSGKAITDPQPNEGSKRLDQAAGQRARRPEPETEAAITPEKALDDWIGRVVGRDWKPVGADHMRPTHQPAPNTEEATPETNEADPATLPLALSLSAVGVGSVAAGSVWQQGPVPDLPVPQAEPGVVPDAIPRSDRSHNNPAQAEPKPILLPTIPGAGLPQPEADAAELIKRLAPFHRAIEIGGFAFPSGIEPDRPTSLPLGGAVPTIQPRAPEPTDQPSLPIRIQPLPLSGGLDFGSGSSSSSGGSKHSSDDHPPQRLPPIAPPPPQTEGRLSDLLIRAYRETSGSTRPGSTEKPKQAAPPEKNPTPRTQASEPKAAPATSSAPSGVEATGVTGPPAPKRSVVVADVPTAKATALDPPSAAPRRIDHVMVDLTDDTGDHGRLRLALSGSTVRATILPNDPELADRLTAGIRELRQNLEDRGFPEPRLTVQLPKSDSPLGGHLFGRDVLTEVRGLAAKGESRAPSDEDPRGRWQADQSSRQARDQRHQNRQQRGQPDEGGGQTE